MPAEPSVLTVQATDVSGKTTLESLIVQLIHGGYVRLDPEYGKSYLVDAGELRAALEPRREVRAA